MRKMHTKQIHTHTHTHKKKKKKNTNNSTAAILSIVMYTTIHEPTIRMNVNTYSSVL